GVVRAPSADEQEQRHDDDPASDPEQRTEETGDEADEDEPHDPIVSAWISSPDSGLNQNAPRSSSTSTGRSLRSSRAPRTRTSHRKPGRSCEGSTLATRSSHASAGGPEKMQSALSGSPSSSISAITGSSSTPRPT